MKDRYFSHDQNAMNDPKIMDLRGDYGMEGYGVYWGIIEALSREPDLSMAFSERKANALQVSMAPSFEMLKFIKDCIGYGLFATDGQTFWSNSLRRRFGEIAQTSNRNRAAAMARWNRVRDEGAAAAAMAARPAPGETRPQPMPTMVDPEWKKVVDAYHVQIGQLPMGRSLELLVSYCEDLGGDVIVHAIERTNEANADQPFKFLKVILDSYAEKQVKTVLEAEAVDKDFDRRVKASRAARRGQAPNDAPPAGNGNSDVRWF